MSVMANREHRAGVRVEHEMPLRWYAVPDPGAQASAHDGTTVDVSAVGAAFLTRTAPTVDEPVVIHLRSEWPPLDVAAPARVVRVTRAAGGYRCAVQFVLLDPAHRAALGKFVFALIRERAA
jgi:c-di-GMP-binding flagellar brake protein YcgR